MKNKIRSKMLIFEISIRNKPSFQKAKDMVR